MKRSCGECSNLRTNGCRRPDYCIEHGYCDFSQGRVRPWEVCRACGGRIVKGPGWWETDDVYKTTLLCRGCGLTATYTRDYDNEKIPDS